MTAIEAQLIERLKKLPPNRVAEVMDFVDFLTAREERAAAAQRLTAGLARLDGLELPPVSDDEVEAEIQAARAKAQPPRRLSGGRHRAAIARHKSARLGRHRRRAASALAVERLGGRFRALHQRGVAG
ncbi:DUF2281 domain-containing protein [Roseateles saccharophilus]|uniref:DUF2281 domain-containing protein n=1 Tax=Roseateles saccharophilus TaxID=304 RepID=UPI001FB31204|nr:DUF2281 domain-containing protein [Roseateles saccharophilus]